MFVTIYLVTCSLSCTSKIGGGVSGSTLILISMKVLINGYVGRIAPYLSDFGVAYKLINDPFVGDRSLKHIHLWRRYSKEFAKLVTAYEPDVVICDPGDFASAVLRANIPLIVYLRGHYWQEEAVRLVKDNLPFHKRMAQRRYVTTMDRCMCNSTIILTVSKYLENVVRDKHPDKPVYTVAMGLEPSVWYPEKGMTLKHPCVGLVQKATIWDKTKEMLTLKQVLNELPNVNFYWAGAGKYAGEILRELQQYQNFHYLGNLQHPNKVRQFLTEIDIYVLLTGLDAAPESIREAMLVGKPVIGTNVGGVSESLIDGESGFLIREGDVNDVVEKISYLLNNKERANEMGRAGQNTIKKRFTVENTAKKLLDLLNKTIITPKDEAHGDKKTK